MDEVRGTIKNQMSDSLEIVRSSCTDELGGAGSVLEVEELSAEELLSFLRSHGHGHKVSSLGHTRSVHEEAAVRFGMSRVQGLHDCGAVKRCVFWVEEVCHLIQGEVVLVGLGLWIAHIPELPHSMIISSSHNSFDYSTFSSRAALFSGHVLATKVT